MSKTKHKKICKMAMNADGVNPASQEEVQRIVGNKCYVTPKLYLVFGDVSFQWDGLAIDSEDNSLIIYEVEAPIPSNDIPVKHVHAEVEHLSIMMKKGIGIKRVVYITCEEKQQSLRNIINSWIHLRQSVDLTFEIPKIEYKILRWKQHKK